MPWFVFLIIWVLAFLTSADLRIDKSCDLLSAKVNADVRGDIEDGIVVARKVSNAGYVRLNWMINAPHMLAQVEIDRVDELLIGFMGGRSNTGRYDANSGLLPALRHLSTFTDEEVPPIFCEPQLTTPDDPDWNRELVKFTENPYNGEPFMNATSGLASFRYLNCLLYMYKCFWLGEIGQIPCKDGLKTHHASAKNWDGRGNNLEYIMLCASIWDPGRGFDIPVTINERAQNRARTGKSLDQYGRTLPAVLMHELHHSMITGSTDLKLAVPIPRREGLPPMIGAYFWAGVTTLAIQKPALSQVVLAKNAETVLFFALACYLFGNDWALNDPVELTFPPVMQVIGDTA